MDNLFSYISYIALIVVVVVYVLQCIEKIKIKAFMGNLFEDIIALQKHLEDMAKIADKKSNETFHDRELSRKHIALGKSYKYSATKVNGLIRKYNSEYPKTFFSNLVIDKSKRKLNFLQRIVLLFVKEESVIEKGEISEMEIFYKRYKGVTHITKTEMRIKERNENKHSRIK